MTVLPPSLTALESLPRVELQSLLKLHGLKGANKKTSDMVDILTEFFQEKALSGETVPYPLLNNEENMVKEDADIAVAAEPATAFVEIQEQILEPKVPTLDPIEPSTIVSEDCTKATEESPVEAEEGATQLAVRAFLRRSVPEENGDDLVSLMEKEGLLDWVLLRSLTLQDMRSMGLTMGLALRLLLAIKEEFKTDPSPQQDSPVPSTVSELHLLVNAMVQLCLDKKKKEVPVSKKVLSSHSMASKQEKKPGMDKAAHLSLPTLSNKPTATALPVLSKNSDNLQAAALKKSKLYAGVKSVVSSYRAGPKPVSECAIDF